MKKMSPRTINFDQNMPIEACLVAAEMARLLEYNSDQEEDVSCTEEETNSAELANPVKSRRYSLGSVSSVDEGSVGAWGAGPGFNGSFGSSWS